MPAEGLAVAGQPQKPLFPNPFYVILLLASTAFVVTAMGYFVSPLVAQKAAHQAGAATPRSLALAEWFDRNGPLALGIEVVLMFIFAVMAMVTDHWFSPKPSRRSSGSI